MIIGLFHGWLICGFHSENTITNVSGAGSEGDPVHSAGDSPRAEFDYFL